VSGALLVARCALAVVFAFAAIAKLTDQASFRRTLADFGASPALIAPGALAIPLAELVVATLLIPTPTAAAAALAALLLLATFSFAAARLLARGETPDCGCMGTRPAPIGRSTLVRNALLATAAAAVVAGGPGASLSQASAGAGPLVAVLGALVLAQAWFCLVLLRRHGQLVERLRALEGAQEPAPASPPVPAPVQHLPAVRQRVPAAMG
jgi:hypothetical protein